MSTQSSSAALIFLIVLGLGNPLSAFNLWGNSGQNASDYGVDHSFPIHHYIDKNKSPYFAKRYDTMIQGCYDKFSRRECEGTERARIAMNLEQPASQHNYTEIGFKKLRAPPAAWDPLIAFYEANKNEEKLEEWPRGNTYVNSWDSPTYMVSLENRSLRGGLNVKQQIWAGVKPILEEWTGQQLEPTSLYGIRVYKDGAILSTHVDRLPLVSSCIIQVAQDIDEPWPIEVYDHAGKAYNVTMQPGDMVLYESHTVLHGRPFPMKGRKYANVFVHFKPINHDTINEQELTERRLAKKKGVTGVSDHIMSLLSGKDAALKKLPPGEKGHIGGHEQSNHDEDHVREHMERIDRENAAEEALAKMLMEKEEAQLDTKAAALKAALDAELNAEREAEEKGDHSAAEAARARARKLNPGHPPARDGRPLLATTHDANARFNRAFTPIDETEDEGVEGREVDQELMEALRDAAANADRDALSSMLDDQHKYLLKVKDENGWTLLHEAIRGGDVETVRLLVSLGASTATKVNDGGAALWVARSYLEDGHPVIGYLIEIGAPEEEEL